MKIEALKLYKDNYSKYSLPADELLHSYRVAKTSFKIGFELDLSEKQQAELFTAALFHDIGKAMISKSIIGKKGKLTLEERKQIELHPIYSEMYLMDMKENKKLSKIVRAHHERWDGKGYPDGLKGEHIPLLARIISIADVYDALKHPRVYRPYGFGSEEMKIIMQKGSGKQFDPRILKVFLNII